MSLFSKKPKISSPSSVTHSTLPQIFSGTTIEVRHSGIPYPGGGNYQDTVLRHLEEIRSFPVGQQFFQALTAFGKKQAILYNGVNSNQAAGSPMGYTLLRKYNDNGDDAKFAAELRLTMQRAGLSSGDLGDLLGKTQLNNWQGGVDQSPFPMFLQDRIAVQVETWLKGATRLGHAEMDVLMLALYQTAPGSIKSGSGVGTRINYDPHKTSTAGIERPPQVKLFHELIHAYYNAGGNQLGREDSAMVTNGGRLFELMSVGLPPFDTAPFSENKLRAEWPGCPQATVYP